MVKIFLDANYIISIIDQRIKIDEDELLRHQLVVSPLSVHILMYVLKNKAPNNAILNYLLPFTLIPFDEQITKNALFGPTSDFEDNVQLHSAVQAKCELFLTDDKELLKIDMFDTVKIRASLQ